MEMELFSGLRIGMPSNYPWIIVSAIVLLLLILQGKKQKSTIRKMIHDKNESFLLSDLSSQSKKLATCSFFLIILLSSISLLQPKWGFHWEEVKRHGVDVIVAIDVSKSMLAEDIKPNRLIRAKRKILDLLNIVEGDRVGLIAFAGTSFLQCPLTLDYGAFRMFLDLLDTDLIPQQGTAIDDAIHLSIEAFKSSAKKSKALILITDGEGHSGSYLEAAKQAKEEGIKIYTMGFGSAQGHPIPDPAHKGKNLKDSNGNLVISKLNEKILQEIALETGGVYAQAQNNDDDLQLIYVNEIQTKIQKNNIKSSRQKRYENRFQYFLLFALVFILLESYLKQAKCHLPLIKKRLSSKTLILLIAFSSTSYANNEVIDLFGVASSEEQLYQEGQTAYKDKKFKTASEAFAKAELENPESHKNLYNVGSSLYKSGDYQRALSYFERSKDTENSKVKASSLYNLGNSHYRMGQLDKALSSYEDVLKVAPNHENAKKNLEFVRKKIKEKLDKQKKNQKNKNKNQQNKDQKEQKNKDQKQKDQQNQKDSKNQQSQEKQQGDKGQKKKDQEKQKKKESDKKKGEEKKKEKSKAEKEKEKQEQEQKKAAEQAKKKDEKGSEKGKNKSEQMKRGKRLSKEEAQRFLNRMRRENKNQMKEFIKYKLNKRGTRDTGGKEW